MNTFSAIDQSIKSTLVPTGKLLFGRSVNGTFHGQFLLTEKPYTINVFYINLTTIQKNEIITFYENNKMDEFNFTYQLFSEDYICRFTAPPKVKMSKALNKWDLNFKVIGYKTTVCYYYIDELDNYYVDLNGYYYTIE